MRLERDWAFASCLFWLVCASVRTGGPAEFLDSAQSRCFCASLRRCRQRAHGPCSRGLGDTASAPDSLRPSELQQDGASCWSSEARSALHQALPSSGPARTRPGFRGRRRDGTG